MENWYKTIPLTTPSLKKQYLKPQIKQAHLSIKPPLPHQNLFEINKLSPSPLPLLPLWGFNWGFPQSAGSMQEIYKQQTDPDGNEAMKKWSKKKNEKPNWTRREIM